MSDKKNQSKINPHTQKQEELAKKRADNLRANLMKRKQQLRERKEK